MLDDIPYAKLAIKFGFQAYYREELTISYIDPEDLNTDMTK